MLPLSWSRVNEDALNLTAAVHINEIMQRVPGAWIARGNGQESLPSLRSPVFTGAGSCAAFYMAADGISLRAPGFCNVNQLFDANAEQAGRIEVIKGPATALYGSNAMHGVINLISAAPSETLDHRASVEVGPHDYYRAKYRYGNTRGAHGLSININLSTDGGYKDDSGYDQQKTTLRHDYTGTVWSISSVLDAANLNQDTAGYIQGFEAYEDEDLKDKNLFPDAYRDAWSVRFHSRASRALDESSTLVITPYLRDNSMEFLQHFLPWQSVEENGHSSLGLRLAIHTDEDDYHWINGIDLEYTDGWLKETQEDDFSGNQPAGVHYDYQVDAVVAALYSQLRMPLGQRWELNGGLRYEYTEYDYNNRTGDGSACAPEATDCRFFRPPDRKDDFDDVSLNAGLSYAFTDDHMGYLRLARGFRAPQATELYRLQAGQQVADLDSEQVDSVELGLRGSSGDLQYNFAVYAMDKEEVIFQDSDRHNISGAETSHRGLELGIDYRLAQNWRVDLQASVARHEYDNAIQLLGSSGDIKGNDIDTSPKIFGSARLNWNTTEVLGRESQAELEWIYLDSYYLDPDNKHRYDGHSLLNLRFSGRLGTRWDVGLRITNLLDEDYAERADFAFRNYRYFVGEPRGFYLQLGYRFGET
jgi:outer membrane receptor protein involved in Fe transport